MLHRILTRLHTQRTPIRAAIAAAPAVLLLTALPFPAHAQATGVAAISGTIVTPLSVTSSTPLNFGNVLQGVPKTVSRTATGIDTTAAIFTISGDAGAGITIDLTLPQYMSVPTGDRMTISFSSTDCTIDSLGGTPASPGAGAWIGVNPHSLPAARLGGIGGTASLYLGGKITPAPRQAPGTYTADIIISVMYDGT